MNSGEARNTNLSKSSYIQLSVILLVGFILRIYLSTLGSFEGDFHTWIGWGIGLSKVGFSQFYDNYWCDYMPGYLYVLRLLDEISFSFPWLSKYIIYKLPANLADLGISILIFIALRPIASARAAMIASIVYFYNPAALSNSTLWGQIDSFHAFPILLSIILALRKHYILSGLFAALAFMIKPQSIVLFPIIGYIAINPFFYPHDRWSIRNFIPGIKIALTVVVTCTLITLPFIWDKFDSVFYIFTGPLELIIQRFDAAYEQYKFASLNTFNFWGVFAMWHNDETLFLGVSYKTWGTAIFAGFYLLIFISLFRFNLKNNESKKEYTYLIFQAITLILFSLFLFVTRAHERHLLPAIAFFTLIIFRSWIFPYLYAIVSGVYVCNMIYSYVQLNTEYRGIPDSVEQVLIPLMFILYLAALIIVLTNFIRQSFRDNYLE